MKLNDLYPTDDELLEEGLLRVIGKVLKYVAIAIGVIFIVRTFKRGLSSEKKEELQQNNDDLSIYHTVTIGTRLQILRKDKNKAENLYEEMMDSIQGQTEALDYDIRYQKDGKDEYVVNTLFVYSNSSDARSLKKVLDKINDQNDMNFEILQQKRYRV